jgi:hypothetical protein
MSYRYNVRTGVEKVKTNTKRYVLGGLGAITIIGGATGAAFASPTSGPVAGPGCFGQWRAGSVQDINGTAPGTNNAGALYFSQRASTNAGINEDNMDTCQGL